MLIDRVSAAHARPVCAGGTAMGAGAAPWQLGRALQRTKRALGPRGGEHHVLSSRGRLLGRLFPTRARAPPRAAAAAARAAAPRPTSPRRARRAARSRRASGAASAARARPPAGRRAARSSRRPPRPCRRRRSGRRAARRSCRPARRASARATPAAARRRRLDPRRSRCWSRCCSCGRPSCCHRSRPTSRDPAASGRTLSAAWCRPAPSRPRRSWRRSPARPAPC